MDKVIKLKSFNGLQKSKRKISDDENYWILIGEKGKIIDENNKDFQDRVLVIFYRNLDELNLQNHNPIKNSLYILESDLDILTN